MKKRISILILLMVASLIELSLIYFVSKEYHHLNNSTFFIPFLVLVIISSFMGFSVIDHKEKYHNFNLTLGLVILVVIPVIFFISKPEYTYKHAQEMIKSHYQVTISESNFKTITVDGNEFYYIKGKKQNSEVLFSFNPHTGEYTELKK
ncbi:uncharacterized membrane protein YsdA (DUF1294 family) [Bacillus mesophilus]|uniref:Uncharacterized protein n=1 Tax=Bacillus mesophilus TaxID=1808955 RepID=A0A6M0Q7F9_9BACI|nr:hypothetical protein [Bacillus mesophilus]MBM7661087.1 uncharacterized membrane protein YsdA (DUF1294 family) [Bacillus mesophilus]NEY71380.1 hypothetical protein [Bacillus mesophilus]